MSIRSVQMLRNAARTPVNLVTNGASYDSAGKFAIELAPNTRYRYIKGSNDTSCTSGATVLSATGVFTTGADDSSKSLSSVAVTGGGSGFVTVPTVTITPDAGDTGAHAAATANLTPTTVATISVSGGGSGFTSRPTVGISGGSGSGVTAHSVLTGTSVASIAVSSAGTGFTSRPTVSVSGNATATADLKAIAVAIVAGGTGYTAGDVLTVGGGTSTTSVQITVDTVAAITGIILTAHVSRAGVYTALPANPVAVTGGTGGNDATFNLTWGVNAVTVGSGGSGYTDVATASIVGGGGSAATLTPLLTATSVATVVVDTAGTGFVDVPTIGFTGGGGTGATATAHLTATSIASVTVTDAGSGFAIAPTIGFSGGSGSGATATASLGAITAFEIILTGTASQTVGAIVYDTTDTFSGVTYSSLTQHDLEPRGIHVIIDVTAVSGSPSLVFRLSGYDPISGKAYLLLASAAITAVGTTIMRVFPGAAVSANVSANDTLPPQFVLECEHATTDAVTYSVGANLMT